MTFKSEDNGKVYDVHLQENGTLKLATSWFHLEVPNITVSPEMVHTADGTEARNIILINDLFPGPILEVVGGADVGVKVVNRLEREGISIHWHGIHMRDNVWMDGVPYLTQCPIHPRQSFTYRFIANPPGHIYIILILIFNDLTVYSEY
jgi:FtsP/CotA-like multicopper oxidase with cupredoxin domain